MQKTQETRVQSLGREDPMEEGMATHFSILSWRIPWTEEATIHRVTKEQTQLKQLRMHIHAFSCHGSRFHMKDKTHNVGNYRSGDFSQSFLFNKYSLNICLVPGRRNLSSRTSSGGDK